MWACKVWNVGKNMWVRKNVEFSDNRCIFVSWWAVFAKHAVDLSQRKQPCTESKVSLPVSLSTPPKQYMISSLYILVHPSCPSLQHHLRAHGQDRRTIPDFGIMGWKCCGQVVPMANITQNSGTEWTIFHGPIAIGSNVYIYMFIYLYVYLYWYYIIL